MKLNPNRNHKLLEALVIISQDQPGNPIGLVANAARPAQRITGKPLDPAPYGKWEVNIEPTHQHDGARATDGDLDRAIGLALKAWAKANDDIPPLMRSIIENHVKTPRP